MALYYPEKVKDLLLNQTEKGVQKRKYYFHPDALKRFSPECRQEEFIKRFLLRRWYYHTDKSYPVYERAPFQMRMYGYFYNALFNPNNEQTQRYSIATARTFEKTWDIKCFIEYALTYQLHEFLIFTSNSFVKITSEFKQIADYYRGKNFVADFGKLLYKDTQDNIILFNPDPNSTEYDEDGNRVRQLGSSILGTTVSTFARGINYKGRKPTGLISDDIETAETQLKPTETQNNWIKYSRDGRTSLDPLNSFEINIMNYTSVFGNQQKLLDSTDEENKMIVGYFTDETDKELSWPGKYVWNDADKKIPGNENKVSIESEIRDAKKVTGGMETFRKEKLCRPFSSEQMFYDIKRIHTFCKPMDEPYEEFKDGALVYRVYKPFDPEMLYIAGVDTSEGLGLDSNTLVLIGASGSRFEVVANVATDTTSQSQFAMSNIRFFTYYGTTPTLNVERNRGHEYINKMGEPNNYPLSLMHLDEDKKVGTYVTNATRSLHANRLRGLLENGSLLNHSLELNTEITQYTNIAFAESTRVPTFGNSDETSQHFDIIKAAEMAAAALEGAIRKGRIRAVREEQKRHRPVDIFGNPIVSKKKTVLERANPYS